jgi:Protein of unknown function (DUF1552)
MHVSRRSLLSGVGLGAAALLGGSFERQAFGQAAAPKRLVMLYMPNSNIRANWVPTGGRVVGASGDATMFQLNKCNTTLEPVRQYMTVIDGLDLKKIGGDPHGSGLIRLVTGGTINAGEGAKDPEGGSLGTGNLPVMPSFDQLVADKSASLKGPPVYSLQLAGDTRADEGRTDVHLRVMSYDLKLNPMPPEVEPTKTFTRLFANVMSGGSSPEAQQAAALALAQEKSVLDFIKGDLGKLSQRLPTDQKPKLDSHLAAIQEYERTLMPSTVTPGVTIPAPPELVTPNVSENHQKILSQYFGITKLAFQLDITRVVTMMFGSGNSQIVVPGVANLTKGIHPTAHDYLVEPLTEATAWYCDQVSKFILDLQATKDIDGSSLLDNTIVMLASETGQYHEFTNIPMVLFGGSKLGLKGGRCLHYTDRTPSDMWTAVAGALDAPMATFGDPAYNKGALPELFG